MVYLNNQKYACESCIKGHRSSSCQHTDRPLFEIKKKGRPVSQCEKCRELRKTKRMHNKCSCTAASCANAASPDSNNEPSTSTKGAAKSRRFKPIAPALPNGLRDIHAEQNDLHTVSATSADIISTSCCCDDSRGCQCHTANSAVEGVPRNDGLATLAEAAAFCCSQVVVKKPPMSCPQMMTNTSTGASSPCSAEQQLRRRKQPLDCCSGHLTPQPQSPQHKRHKSNLPVAPTGVKPLRPPLHGLELPPLLYTSDYAAAGRSFAPEFPAIPPLSHIASLAGSGCSCGLQCACPGCVKHRGEQHALKHFNDCADGCGTCVDHEGGVELPDISAPASSLPGSGSSSHTNFLDEFFARAASLPLPPSTRTTSLDATNVTVYPSTLFSGTQKEREERSAAFGLVTLPPLECDCTGGCGCPAGRCECGDACAGCCDDGSERMGSTPRMDTQSTRGVSSFADRP